MRFIGTIGFDNGGFDLHSRTTQEVSWTEGARWYFDSLDYFEQMIKYDNDVREIIITLWDASTANNPTAEPIEQMIFRKA